MVVMRCWWKFNDYQITTLQVYNQHSHEPFSHGLVARPLTREYCQDPTKWRNYLQTHRVQDTLAHNFIPASTSMVDNPDPRILISHCRYSSSGTSMSSPSIIPIDHIPRHGQRHSYSFLISLSIFIHSTLVYSYCHFVSFPQFEYQLSFSQSFVSLVLEYNPDSVRSSLNWGTVHCE